MKYILIILIALAGCRPQAEKEAQNPLVGSWQLVYAHTEENDTVTVKDMSGARFIKIINDTHFAFLNQVEGTRDGFYGGGGTYVLDGQAYTETLSYVGNPDLRRHQFTFQVEVKGDSLIQQGVEKVEEAGLDRYIVEKYLRISTVRTF